MKKCDTICVDIQEEEVVLRELFSMSKSGEDTPAWDADCNYNIRRRAIFNTYCKRKYSLDELNYRLHKLNLKKNTTMLITFPIVIGAFSGIIAQIIFEWLKVYSEWERLALESTYKAEFSTLLHLVSLPIILLLSTGLLIGIIVFLLRNHLKKFLSDDYILADYERNIIEAQLVKLRNNSFQSWRNSLQENANQQNTSQ